MAYALRYYKELIHEDGSAHRLEIHKKDSTAEAVEIGAVIQGLALEIQGSQGDVDSPIVKTSLSMTFVDAGDIEDGRKNGFWQEFYTPDALLWKVILKARTATETSFRTMWGGYVTPDSFSESLVYRGSVNIIARDNIGHMQDFPFDAVGDADGMISLRNLVEAGWEKIQSPMVLDWRGETESNMWLMCDGVPAPDTLMNVSQFEGMDWYKAIETALASYGIVMRWVGDNIVNVSSLRSMPLQGREVMDNLSQITPVFVAGAQRELVPAVRRIEESVSYDLQETLSMPKLDSSAFTGDTQSYRCKIDGVDIGYGQFGTLEHDAPIWPINPNNGWSDEDDATTLFFNPNAYELGSFASRRGLGDEIYRYMYIAANNVDDRRVSFTRSITCADVTISMKLGQPCNLDILNKIEQQSVFNLKRITFAVILEQGGVTRYYNGWSWGASYAEISVDYDPTSPSYEFSQFVSMGDNAGAAELTFCIVKIEYAQTSYVGNSSVYGLYACIQDLSFNIPESSSLLSDNSVNTVYNAENNVVLSRTPEIGPAYNAVALPGLIKNGIFYRSGDVILPARAWGWSGSTPQQMAVYNHLQLLCYYAKPNNLISGTIVNGDLTRGGAIYLWHGKEHLLVSGRYNLLNGMIEGAMLREFTRYEAMWGEVSETAFPDTEQDSTTNVEGGASSGGSSSTYTNTTTVNIGSGGGGGASYLNDLLDVNTDSVTAQSVLYYNGTEWVGRSLSAILNGYAKSADLLTLSNLLASMWSIDDDGNLVTDKQVIIKNNLIVKGDTASGGTGGGAAIGVTGILVDGKQYTDNDSDGYIDLSEAFAGLSPTITSAMITEALGYTPVDSASLGSLATKDSVAWSEITNVLTGGDEFNIIPSGHNGVFSFNHRAKDGGSGTITEYRMRNGAGNYAPVRALSFIAHGGTSSQFLKADGSLDSTRYLPLSGGTMTGSLTLNEAVLYFISGGKQYAYNVNTGNGEPIYLKNDAWHTLYHSGNFNPADYLPLTGGIIDGNITIRAAGSSSDSWLYFTDNGTSEEYAIGIRRPTSFYGLQFNSKGSYYTIYHSGNFNPADYLPLTGGAISGDTDALKIVRNTNGYSAITYYNTQNGVNTLLGVMGFDSNGEPSAYRASDNIWRTIIHSGNIRSYAVITKDGIIVNDEYNIMGYGSIDGGWPKAGPAMAWGSWTGYRAFLHGRNGVLSFNTMENGTLTGWKTIAFTDSNVASANKLIMESGAEYATFGSGYTEFGLTSWSNYINGSKVIFRNASAQTMFINSAGNVTIGDSDLAGAKYKLYVDYGKSHFAAWNSSAMSLGYAQPNSVLIGDVNNGLGIWYQYLVGSVIQSEMFNGEARAENLAIQPLGGNVLIGTTTDAGYKLYVEGTTYHSTELYLANWAYLASYKTDGSRVLMVGLNNNNLLTINQSGSGVNTAILGGNVGIGTTDPSFKLHVDGTAKINDIVRLGANIYVSQDSTDYGLQLWGGANGGYIGVHARGTFNSTNMWFGYDGATKLYGAVTMESTLSVTGASTFNGKLTIDLGATQQALRVNGESTLNGSVSIIKALSVSGLSNLGGGAILGGTTRPSLDNTHSLGIDGYRWSILYAVNGNLSGNLIVSGDVASGSDVRFKDIVTYHRFKTEDIANAPLFTFRWNDRKDKAEHLGTSAQYWENVAPWLVKGEDFKTLDYATLGVAIGISLANKTMNHDERIKTLEKEIKTLRDEIRSIRHGICN